MRHYQELFCAVYQRFPYSDIVCRIIQSLKDAEHEEARRYHLERFQGWSHWAPYDISDISWGHRDLLRDLHILSTPQFWELVVTDDDGLTIDRLMIDAFAPIVSKNPRYPGLRYRWLKIQLYNRFRMYIHDIWKVSQRYPDQNFHIQFSEDISYIGDEETVEFRLDVA
jgi:hypothetical protein